LTLGLLMLAPAALAEWGTIILGPNRPEAVIDAERLQGLQKNIYEVTVGGSADGLLSVELRPNQRTMHPHFRLIDADNGTIEEAYADDDGMVARLQVPIGPGRYTLEVGDSHGVTRERPYQLTSRFQPVSDRYEPNDDFGEAKLLRPGEYAQITLFRYKEADRDTFVYRHAGGTLHVEATPASNLSPSVTIYNAQREAVGSGYAANPGAALQYDERQPEGRYFLVFSDSEGNNLPHPINVMATSR
jgi:hypothetical protein